MAPRERQSNFELLRLTAMVLIVVQHYSGFTTWAWDRSSPTHRMTNEIFMQILSTPGKVGVNIFLMLTGYFLNGRPIKPSSVMRTWIQCIMWSWILFITVFLYEGVPSNLYRPLLTPITGHGYWFLSSYVAVMFCTGWIAALAKQTTPAQFVAGLGVLFVLMSVLDWNTEMRYCNTQWFIFSISVGAFLRRFKAKFDQIKTRTLYLVLAAMCIFNWSTVAYFTIHSDWPFVQRYSGPTMFMRNNWSIETLCFAIIMFLITTRIEVKSQTINTAASCTLGVYLIHENQLITPRFWQEWVHGEVFKDSVFFPIIALLHVGSVYIGLTILEYIRYLVLGKLEEYLSSRLGAIGDAVGEFINSKLKESTEDVELA